MLVNDEKNKTILLEQLNISTRLYNIAKRNGINNLYELIENYESGNFANFKYAGKKCIDEIVALCSEDIMISEEETSNDKNEELEIVPAIHKPTKEIDYRVVERLKENFGFKVVKLCEWYGITRQGADIRFKNAKKKQEKHSYTWEGFEYNQEEEKIFERLLREECNSITENNSIYELYSDLNGNVCFIIVSDENIRCFFIDDISDKLRDLVCEKRVDRFTFEELDILRNSKHIMRLKEQYIIPSDKNVFSAYARKRNMSNDEYALFLSGSRFGTERGITDDEIIAFLESNLNEEGQVHIKADPKNQWIKSYASRNGFKINEFIEFYGYKSALSSDLLTAEGARQRHLETMQKYLVTDNAVYIPCTCDFYRVLNSFSAKRKITITEYIEELGFRRLMSLEGIGEEEEIYDEGIYESNENDMQVYATGEEFIEKVFNKNPLLGNYIFSEKNLQVLNNSAKKIVDKIVTNCSYPLTDREKKILALSVINYAKKWDTDKGTFTNYIIKQYGYRSEDRVYYPMIGEVFSAIKDSGRWAFCKNNKNQYKSTIMIHAMGSIRSWMMLCDFLSDFYQNNLGCNFNEDDPYVLKMVFFLRSIFYKSEIEENDNYVEFTLGAKPYRFQEGIRKLIVFRPNYAATVFARMLRRIDESMSSMPTKASTYEDELVDLWFKKKKDFYSRFRDGETERRRKHQIAYSYNSIRVEYKLIDGKLCLDIPDVRIEDDSQEACYLEVRFSNGVIFERKKLECYGNELGKTIRGFYYDMSQYLASEETDTIAPQVLIEYGEKIIYDSELKLARKTLCFDKERECAWSAIDSNKYTVVASKFATISGEHVYITSEKTIGKYRFTDIELDEEYALVIDDVIVSFERKSVQNISLSISEHPDNVKYCENGQEYALCRSKRDIKISLDKDDKEQKYLFFLNENRIFLTELDALETEEKQIYKIPEEVIDFKNHLQIVDVSTNQLLYDEWFAVIPSFNYYFDREYYFSKREIRESIFVYRLGEIEREIPNCSGDTRIEIPYAKGNIVVELPLLKVKDSFGRGWESRNYHINEIEETDALYISSPVKLKLGIKIGELELEISESGKVLLGNGLRRITDKREEKIVLEVSNDSSIVEKYELGRVKYDEMFVSSPKIEYDGRNLMWDKGYGFIGEQNERTYIIVSNDAGEEVLNSEINIHDSLIKSDLLLEDGEYAFQIFRNRAGEIKGIQCLAEGNFMVGDVDRIRFQRCRIEVSQIVFDNAVEIGTKNILSAYVDNIRYEEELSKEECSEGICPRYTGTMYFINPEGKRHDYAFEKEIRSETDVRIKTNPVNLTYINDGIMLITDCDQDALMYRYYVDKDTKKKVYHITDHARNEWEKDRYDTVDLVRYVKVKEHI